MDKKNVELRYDRNPKNFQPKEKDIIQKIIAIQNYYHAREKIQMKSPKRKENSEVFYEKIEHLENYDKLLENEKSQENLYGSDSRVYIIWFFIKKEVFYNKLFREIK